MHIGHYILYQKTTYKISKFLKDFSFKNNLASIKNKKIIIKIILNNF
jgi:hypothetical protein